MRVWSQVPCHIMDHYELPFAMLWRKLELDVFLLGMQVVYLVGIVL